MNGVIFPGKGNILQKQLSGKTGLFNVCDVICKIRRYEARASFTIEAAVTVPIAMCVLTAMIFAAFFLHNHVTMTAVNDYLLLTGADPAQAEPPDASGLLSDRLIGVSEVSASLNSSDMSASIVSSAGSNTPGGLIGTLLDGKTGGLSSQMQFNNLDGRKKLLLYKSICDGVGSITEIAGVQN